MTQCRLTQHMTASPLLAGLMPYRADRLANRDREQHAPEIVAIGQLGKLALASAVAEALKSAEGDIFLVDRAPGMAGQSRARQPDQPLEITIPEPLDRIFVARFETVRSSM